MSQVFRLTQGFTPTASEPSCTKTVPKPYVIGASGLTSSEKQIPEIVENIENRRQRMESLECPNALAKQVLSQLSYTPTVGVTPHSKAFPRAPKSIPSLFGYHCTKTDRSDDHDWISGEPKAGAAGQGSQLASKSLTNRRKQQENGREYGLSRRS
ncbi:MAG TPA: hypothetical protein VNO32_59415 [Candidatus Acidoferrum sp.]|nr:hypothetical protein [Candidatus Acidoferrum sp.]